jgi:hypothetical protein
MSISTSILQAQLLNTGLAVKDQPLYQFLNSLLIILRDANASITDITNITNKPVTTVIVGGTGGLIAEDPIVDDAVMGGGGGGVGFITVAATATEATLSTNQTFTSGVEAAISFNGVTYDTSTMWSAGSPTRLTASIGGKYLVNALVEWATGLSGTVHTRVYKNGILVYENTEVGADLSSGNEYHGVTTVVSLTPADYIELKILVTLLAGGSINAIGNGIWFQAALESPQVGPQGPAGPTGPQGIQGVPGATIPVGDEGWEDAIYTYPMSTGVGGPSSGLVLVEEHTAAAATSLNFTTGITSAYDDYFIEIVNLVNGSAATFFFRCSTTGGASWDIGNNYNWSYQYNFATSNGAIGVNTDTAINWRNSTTTLAANGSWNGGFRLQSPGSALFKAFVGQLSFHDGTTGLIFLHGGGEYQITTAVNAFQVGVSAGTFNGTVRLYGLSK